jgi:hypothetical protein
MKNKPVMILCCPRSGSQFIADVLKQCNMDVSHESAPGINGIVSWFLVPTFSNNSIIKKRKNFKSITDGDAVHILRRPNHIDYPIPTEEFKEQYQIIHQVREPVKSIASMFRIMPRSWVWTDHFIDIVPFNANSFSKHYYDTFEQKTKRNMYMWYHWNIAAEKQALFTYRVENIKIEAKRIAPLFNISADTFIQSMDNTSKTTNHRAKPPDMSWDIMETIDPHMTQKIKALAARYGYITP